MKTLTSLPISRVDLFVCLTCLSVFLSVVSVCYSIRRVCLLLFLSCLSATLPVVSICYSIRRVCLLVYLSCLSTSLSVVSTFFFRGWLVSYCPTAYISNPSLCSSLYTIQAVSGNNSLGPQFQYWVLGPHISSSILGPGTSFYFQYWDLGIHFIFNIGTRDFISFSIWDMGPHFIFNIGT